MTGVEDRAPRMEAVIEIVVGRWRMVGEDRRPAVVSTRIGAGAMHEAIAEDDGIAHAQRRRHRGHLLGSRQHARPNSPLVLVASAAMGSHVLRWLPGTMAMPPFDAQAASRASHTESFGLVPGQ